MTASPRLRAAVLALGASACAASPALDLSYEQAAARLNEVSDAVRAAAAGTTAKLALAEATRSLRLPEVSLDAKEILLQKSLEIPLGATGPALGLPSSLDIVDKGWHFRPTVSVVMPLYSGGKISAAQRAAQAGYRQARAEEEGERHNQSLQLVQAYFGQQLAGQVLRVRGQVREGLQRHLDDATKLEQGGMATKAQRLQATVARDQAERDYQKAANDHATQTAALALLLRADQPVATSTPLFVLREPLRDLPQMQAAARANNPQLARLQALADQAEQGVAAKQAELKPQVFLFGQRDLHRSSALLTDPDWVVGIGLKYTFFSGSDRPRQISAAESQLAQVRAGREEMATQIDIAVTRAINGLDSARQQFLLLDSAQAQARENLRLQELSFREGQATSLDVIDARLRLGSVAAERAQAAYQFDVLLAQLLALTGQMDQFPSYAAQAGDKVFEHE